MPPSRLLITLNGLGMFIAAVSCGLLLLFVLLEVALRELGVPFYLSTEYTGYLMAFLIAFPLGTVTRQRKHLYVDFVPRLLTGWRSWLVRVFNRLFLLAYASVLFFVMFRLGLASWNDGIRSLGPLRTLIAVPQLVATLGFALLLLNAVVELFTINKANINRDEAYKETIE